MLTAALLSQVAMGVQDTMCFADTILVCFIFVHVLHFLLHTLPGSFTSGEAVCVATMLSLLLTHACISVVAQLLLLRGPVSPVLDKFALGAERAMVLPGLSAAGATPLSIREHHGANPMSHAAEDALAAVRFYNAAAGLVVGVIVLGLLWFRTAVVPFMRAARWQAEPGGDGAEEVDQIAEHLREEDADTVPRSRPASRRPSRQLEHAFDAVATDDVDVQASIELREVATGDNDATDETKNDASSVVHRPVVRKRRAAPVASSEVGAAIAAAEAQAAVLARGRGGRRGSSARIPRPPVLPPAVPFSVPMLYASMVAVIAFVVWPYLFVEMGCEPFSYIWRFIVAMPPTGEPTVKGWRKLGLSPPPAEEFSSLHSAHGIAPLTLPVLDTELDVSFLTKSTRAAVIVAWVSIMALGVFLCAPSGTARVQEQHNESQSLGVTAESKQVEGQAGAQPLITSVNVAPSAPNSPAAGSAPHSGAAAAVARPAAPARRVIPNILVRKYYHFLAVAMFVPAILLEPAFVALAFSVALSIFILMEYFRIGRIPPFGSAMHEFMKVSDTGGLRCCTRVGSVVSCLAHARLLLYCVCCRYSPTLTCAIPAL